MLFGKAILLHNSTTCWYANSQILKKINEMVSLMMTRRQFVTDNATKILALHQLDGTARREKAVFRYAA